MIGDEPESMTAGIFVQIVFFICLATAVVFAVRLRQSKLHYIADYQVGLRPKSDGSSATLPPGVYRSRAAGTPITVVDMRPRQFILERLAFHDIVQANSVISVGGELVIRDPQHAVNAFKNLVEDSLTIIRERLLHTVSRYIVDPSIEGRAKIAATIITELDPELESRGVGIEHFEITELWVQAVKHNISPDAN
jgi:hypothetical protein